MSTPLAVLILELILSGRSDWRTLIGNDLIPQVCAKASYFAGGYLRDLRGTSTSTGCVYVNLRPATGGTLKMSRSLVFGPFSAPIVSGTPPHVLNRNGFRMCHGVIPNRRALTVTYLLTPWK